MKRTGATASVNCRRRERLPGRSHWSGSRVAAPVLVAHAHTLLVKNGGQPCATRTSVYHRLRLVCMTASTLCAETRGEPATFPLGQAGSLIDCWNMAVPTLHVGDTALITCASAYAYGDSGYPPRIPAGATIRFKLTVISVEEPSKGGHDDEL